MQWQVAEATGVPTITRQMADLRVDGQVAGLRPFPGAPLNRGALDSCYVNSEGFATPTIWYTWCANGDAMLHRFMVDGTALPTTAMPPLALLVRPVVDIARGRLYAWDPFKRTLAAIDLNTGAVIGTVAAPAPSAATPSGLFDQLAGVFGNWIAPTVAAKVNLAPGLVLSPDGRRLYALGVTGTDITEAGGSAGVFAFDTDPLRFVANWRPVADYSSLALSSDGSLLYAAGMSGTDAAGRQTDQPASLTAYDTATGAVRAIFGDLRSQVDFQLNDR